jgi:hypothetical protein
LLPSIFSLPEDGTIMESERNREKERAMKKMKNVKEYSVVNEEKSSLNFFTMAHFEVLHILHPCKKVGS